MEAAANLGYEFSGNSQGEITINILGEIKKVKILEKFGFDSNRKRMSVVI